MECRRSDSRYSAFAQKLRADRRAASQLAAEILGTLPRAALGGSATSQDSLAPGYYRPPLQGFQLAASAFAQQLRRTGRRRKGRNAREESNQNGVAVTATVSYINTQDTINALKTILKFILYAGAVACCLPGLWVIYVAIANFREMQFPAWIVVLILEAIFVCLAFTPAFMLLKGLKTKTWHWVIIGIAEVIVVAATLFALFVFTTLA